MLVSPPSAPNWVLISYIIHLRFALKTDFRVITYTNAPQSKIELSNGVSSIWECEDKGEILPLKSGSVATCKSEIMALCYRNQMLFYNMMQQQNHVLEGLDLAIMEPGSRRLSSDMLMTKPKKKFKSAAELGLKL